MKTSAQVLTWVALALGVQAGTFDIKAVANVENIANLTSIMEATASMAFCQCDNPRPCTALETTCQCQNANQVECANKNRRNCQPNLNAGACRSNRDRNRQNDETGAFPVCGTGVAQCVGRNTYCRKVDGGLTGCKGNKCLGVCVPKGAGLLSQIDDTGTPNAAGSGSSFGNNNRPPPREPARPPPRESARPPPRENTPPPPRENNPRPPFSGNGGNNASPPWTPSGSSNSNNQPRPPFGGNNNNQPSSPRPPFGNSGGNTTPAPPPRGQTGGAPRTPFGKTGGGKTTAIPTKQCPSTVRCTGRNVCVPHPSRDSQYLCVRIDDDCGGRRGKACPAGQACLSDPRDRDTCVNGWCNNIEGICVAPPQN